jgi:arsenite methyltransferase
MVCNLPKPPGVTGANAMGTLPTSGTIEQAVTARYAGLASGSSSLSCGRALEHAAPVEGETVVDLGCGRGRDVVQAALRVGPRGRAVGVDATDAMIDAARRGVPAGLTNASFVKADLAALTLPDAFAHAVVSNCAINHAPDKGAVYREILRVLRPGGRFVVSDVVSEAPLPDAVRNDPAAWAACYGGAIPEGEYLSAIQAAGFAEVGVVERTAPYEKGGVRVLSLTVRGRK